MRSCWPIIFVACLLCLPASSQAQTNPEIRQFSQMQLESFGQQIDYQDGQAAQASDVLFAQKDRKTLEAEKVRGWIVEPGIDSATVRFLREGPTGLEAAYDVVFTEAIVPAVAPYIKVPADRTLRPDEIAQYSARVLALKNIDRPCSDHYNTVALRDPEGDGWLVWALAASTDPKLTFVGGHYRFTISKDGTQIVRKDPLSRACLTMKRQEPPPGGKLAAQISMQLVSEIPVETHVWLSLQSKLPSIVITPDRNVWAIENGKMQILRKLPENAPAKSP